MHLGLPSTWRCRRGQQVSRHAIKEASNREVQGYKRMRHAGGKVRCSKRSQAAQGCTRTLMPHLPPSWDAQLAGG